MTSLSNRLAACISNYWTSRERYLAPTSFNPTGCGEAADLSVPGTLARIASATINTSVIVSAVNKPINRPFIVSPFFLDITTLLVGNYATSFIFPPLDLFDDIHFVFRFAYTPSDIRGTGAQSSELTRCSSVRTRRTDRCTSL
jgi:hypothetical protein